MPRDKLLHLLLGLIAVAAGYAGLIIHATFGMGACLAYFSTAVGIGYEVQQRIRREGQPDALDALATAAPGWVAWGLLSLI